MKPANVLLLLSFCCLFQFLHSADIGPTNKVEPKGSTDNYFVGSDGTTPCKVCQIDCFENPDFFSSCKYRYYNYGCKRQSYCMTYKTGFYMEANAVTLFCTIFNGCTPKKTVFAVYKAATPGGIAHKEGLKDVTDYYRALYPLGTANRTTFDHCRKLIAGSLMNDYAVEVPKKAPQCTQYATEVKAKRAGHVVTLTNNYIYDLSFPREVIYKREALNSFDGSYYYFYQLIQDIKDLALNDLEFLGTEKGRKTIFFLYKSKYDQLGIDVINNYYVVLPKFWWDLDHGNGVLPLNLNMLEAIYYQHKYEGKLRIDTMHDLIRGYVDSRLALDAQYPVSLINHSYTMRKLLDSVRCPKCTVATPSGEAILSAAQKKLADEYVKKAVGLKASFESEKKKTLNAWTSTGADWCSKNSGVYFCYNNPTCPMLKDAKPNEKCPRYKRRTTSKYPGPADWSEWAQAKSWKLL